jgi:hypothetical protein
MNSAKEAANECREIIPFINNEKDRVDLLTLNPRFGVAPTTSFTPSKVAAIRSRIEAMRGVGDGEPFARIAKPFLNKCRSMFEALPAASPVDVRQLLQSGGDEAHQAHFLRLFPKGALLNSDVQACIEYISLHRGNGKRYRDLILEKKPCSPTKCASIQKSIRAARSKGQTTLPPER